VERQSDSDTVEPRLFSVVSALTPRHAGGFHAELDPHWTIAGKPNGGYLLSLLARAATAAGPHDHVIAASAHYLRPPEPGPVRIEAETLRTGRSASHVRARLEQEGRVCVEALMTVSHLDTGTTAYWDDGLPEVSTSEYAECERLVPSLPNSIPVAILHQIDVRLDPASAGFTTGSPTGRGELRGWLALPGAEDFDPVSLLFAVDSYPPATFDIEFTGWVPTLEMTVYVRSLPAPGPVRVLQRAGLIGDGRVDESCFIWDSTGRLVAQATQLAGIRLG
jgi:hypothetical protein